MPQSKQDALLQLKGLRFSLLRAAAASSDGSRWREALIETATKVRDLEIVVASSTAEIEFDLSAASRSALELIGSAHDAQSLTEVQRIRDACLAAFAQASEGEQVN